MKSLYKAGHILCFVYLGIFLLCSPAVADDGTQNAKEAGGQDTTLGEGSFYTGFRWVDTDGFSRAAEYEKDEFSVVLGLNLETFPLPHRFFIDGEYLGSNNFYGDIAYAYRDIVLVRDLAVGLHHNLDHYSYFHPNSPPGVTWDDRNPGDANSLDFAKNDLFLRLKAPNYPFHAFLKHRYVERDGSLQERYLNGYFGSLNKTSESRDIDWRSNDLTLGLNSHLGPLEVEYAYNRFEFDPGSGSVLYDYFAAGRPPDTYPHNVIPETESNGNSIKLHTSYTGQIVASATFSNDDSTNNYSGAESDAWKAALDLQWVPDPVISMFFRYRYLELEKELPERITLYGARSSVSYAVRAPVSTRKNLFAFAARYRPLGRLTLNGNYEYEMRKRTEIDDWEVLPEDSDIHRLNLTARARLLASLKLKAVYQYQHYGNPAYNIEPDQSNKLRLNVSYTPTSWITTALDYSITVTKRDDLIYGEYMEGERDGRTDRAMASVSFAVSPGTSLTASWATNRWKIEQDTAYSMWDPSGSGTTTPFPYYDRGAPYTDDAQTFAISLYSKLRKDLALKAGVSYTLAESEYLPDPSYLTVYGSRETTETIARVELAKQVLEDWEIGLNCRAVFFEDNFSDYTLDQQDGELYVTMLTLKRYF